MRFYTKQCQFYCGIDLHTRWMYVCILSQTGEIVYHKNLPASPEPFLDAITPFREDLVVGVECMFTWYWLADLCLKERIEFVFGHALYMKAVHGAKVKNDKVDSQKIARKMHRVGIAKCFPDPAVQRSIEVDVELIDHLDLILERLKSKITRTARYHDPQALALLRTVHGIGPTLSLVILYEIHTIDRFDRVQEF